MIIRKIGKIILGKVTPFQVAAACILGAMMGFLPGFTQAPGLLIALLVLLVILNANLFLATCTGFIAKLLSLCLISVSFNLGRILIDGPTHGLFAWMINAPVLALFGFEYYATTGGILIGFIFGLMMSILLIKGVTTVRKKMVLLEEGSVKFQQWTNKKWVKILMFLLVAVGPGKRKWSELFERKIGNPVRIIGAIFAAIVVGLLVIISLFTSGPIVTSALQSGLERVNGATVDIGNADVDLSEGRMIVEMFAMADPNALDTDLLRAETIEVDISTADLLRKRLKLDRVVMTGAYYGAKRVVPGRLIGKKLEPRDTDVKQDTAETREGEKTIDDYVKNAKTWKERLAKIRQWLEVLSGPAADTEDTENAEGKSLRDWLEREAQSKGYANVTAAHLIEGSPKFVVAELIAEKVRVQGFDDKETIGIHGKNLSTHPHLSEHVPSIAIKSSGDTLDAELKLAGVSSAKEGKNTIRFVYRGLDTDSIAENLDVTGDTPISGGTIDIAMEGTIQTTAGTYINLPLQVTLHNSTVNIHGIGPTQIKKLMFPLEIRGPLDNPRITIDNSKLSDAFVRAGAGILTGKLKGEADKLFEKKDKDTYDKAKEFLKGILQRNNKKEDK
jgi:uncharacterized protein (TIGR03546 family)